MTEFFEWRDAPPAQYAVIGDPVSHSLSPKMQNAAFRANGIDASYIAVRVPGHEFDLALEHLQRLGYIGLNVTVPLKERAFGWAVGVQDLYKPLGALNTLSLEGKKGINTDVLAMEQFIQSLVQDGEPRPSVLILGAGGTARALIAYLSRAGFKVAAWNRTRQRLIDLIAQSQPEVALRETADPAGCRFVINATSSSLQGETLPVLWRNAQEDAVAIDCFYSRGPTVYQKDAESNGVATFNGLGLLVRQGALSFEWWTGTVAPLEAMLVAVNED